MKDDELDMPTTDPLAEVPVGETVELVLDGSVTTWQRMACDEPHTVRLRQVD